MKIVKTLAEFISTKRDDLGLSQKGLALKSNIPIETIEAVESGQDLFLATTTRQKLAKALKIETATLKALEKQPLNDNQVSLETIEVLKNKILGGVLTGNKCPVCGSELICRIAKMYDLEDNLIEHPKARCSKCPFLIKT